MLFPDEKEERSNFLALPLSRFPLIFCNFASNSPILSVWQGRIVLPGQSVIVLQDLVREDLSCPSLLANYLCVREVRVSKRIEGTVARWADGVENERT